MFTAAYVYYCKQTNPKSKKNTWHWTVTNNINILTRWLYVLRLIAVTLLHHEFSIQVKIQLLLLYESKISNGVIHQSASHNQHLTLHDYGEWMHQQWNAFVASHDRNCAPYIWSNERDPCCHVAMNPWINAPLHVLFEVSVHSAYYCSRISFFSLLLDSFDRQLALWVCIIFHSIGIYFLRPTEFKHWRNLLTFYLNLFQWFYTPQLKTK